MILVKQNGDDIISALFISIIIILMVIFLVIALDCLLNKSYSYITTSADINIESKIRLIMLKNPKSEIFVIDRTDSKETRKILEKLENDYPEIHIIPAGK